jgi:hypothetical protein
MRVLICLSPSHELRHEEKEIGRIALARKRPRETIPVEWHLTVHGGCMTFDWKLMHAPEYSGG